MSPGFLGPEFGSCPGYISLDVSSEVQAIVAAH